MTDASGHQFPSVPRENATFRTQQTHDEPFHVKALECPPRQAGDTDNPRDSPVDAALKEEDGLGACDSSTAPVNRNDPRIITDVEGDVVAGVLVLDDDGDGVRDIKVPTTSLHEEVHETDRITGDGERCVPDGVENGTLAPPVGCRVFKADSHLWCCRSCL